MDKNLIATQNIKINAAAKKVWNVLTNPAIIKIYLFGTETITDWKVGSPIVFQGEYEGHKDKGNVLENNHNRLLKYDYWSGFSGLEDKPENYSIVTYNIEASSNDQIIFTWTQSGFANEQVQQHSQNGLLGILEQIKKLAEEE